MGADSNSRSCQRPVNPGHRRWLRGCALSACFPEEGNTLQSRGHDLEQHAPVGALRTVAKLDALPGQLGADRVGLREVLRLARGDAGGDALLDPLRIDAL